MEARFVESSCPSGCTGSSQDPHRMLPDCRRVSVVVSPNTCVPLLSKWSILWWLQYKWQVNLCHAEVDGRGEGWSRVGGGKCQQCRKRPCTEALLINIHLTGCLARTASMEPHIYCLNYTFSSVQLSGPTSAPILRGGDNTHWDEWQHQAGWSPKFKAAAW